MSINNDLRQAVLQAAIQGKLTKQLPEDGNAKDLLEQIKAEKAKLIKEGKLKKEKPLPEITEDEKPFDIPENWELCRLGEVISLLSGRDLEPEKYNDKAKGIPYITGASNIQKGTVLVNRWTEQPLTIAKKGNILLTCKGTIGEIAVLSLSEVHIARQIMAVDSLGVSKIQFLTTILSYYVGELKRKARSMIPGISRDDLLKIVVPLPPLSEQKRIVAKVEELMVKIDELEKTENELEALKKAFPADMKAALLQAAMQGKLTEQLPEDGNAKDLLEQIKVEKAKLIKEGKLKKEKPLPEITEDEKPFDIPENWEWCRLGEVGVSLTGNTPSTMKLEYYNGDIPFVGPGDISIDSDINYDTSKKLTAIGAEVARIVGNETLLQVCIGGSIGKACLVERIVAFNQQINALKTIKVLSQFVLSVMKSQMFLDGMLEKSTGTATPIINRTAWEQLLLPLPPLSEQKRIVEKLEKLLPLCDGLK